GQCLTKSANDVQDPEIAVTANGHVYVTYDATLHQGNRSFNAILYNKSTDCGATFSPAQLLTTFNRFTYVDQPAATPEPAQVGAEDNTGASPPPPGRGPISTPPPRTRRSTWCSSRPSRAPRPRPAQRSVRSSRGPAARAASTSCGSTAPPAARTR